MYDYKLGMQLKTYRYSISRYPYLIIAVLIAIGIPLAMINAAVRWGFDWLLLFSLLFVAHAVYIIVREWRFIKLRLTVYGRGLNLQTHEWDVCVALTDIADMYFTKGRTSGRLGRSIFFLHITLKDGRCLQINLLSFDSLLTRVTYDFLGGKTVPKMPELVEFYERWHSWIQGTK